MHLGVGRADSFDRKLFVAAAFHTAVALMRQILMTTILLNFGQDHGDDSKS